MLPQALHSTQSGAQFIRLSSTPASLPPVIMNSQPQRTASADSSADGIRKRVCKACDRCRMKKSKCDGSHPCSRCKVDNAICVFGERKKSHDKVYPKGYVEMLEQQQGQLVAGLQECYRRQLRGESWSGPVLSEATGHPLTHDILSALHLLEPKNDGSDQMETFEEDCQKLQSRLIADGAGYMQRRGSVSSESEHSQHGFAKSSSRGTPPMAKAPVFDKNFTFTPSPSPIAQSPVPRQRQSYPPAQQSPLHRTIPVTNNDPQFYQPEWSLSTLGEPEAIMRSRYALQTPHLQDLDDVSDILGNQRWEESQLHYGPGAGSLSYPQQLQYMFPGMQGTADPGNNLDNMELEFGNFIQVGS